MTTYEYPGCRLQLTLCDYQIFEKPWTTRLALRNLVHSLVFRNDTYRDKTERSNKRNSTVVLDATVHPNPGTQLLSKEMDKYKESRRRSLSEEEKQPRDRECQKAESYSECQDQIHQERIHSSETKTGTTAVPIIFNRLLKEFAERMSMVA